ncbi:MAG: hypothetical protein KDD69_19770 [Bdellovibrionales bacterium]|nr:hypothetical protein [Bdellovibrionales bacterium]
MKAILTPALRTVAALTVLLSTACTIPTSSLTTLSVSGQLLDERGGPVVGKPVEVVLPAAYGLNEIDLEYGRPSSYGHSDQRAVVYTDALGAFSHTFAPVEYSEQFWLLPPLGTLPESDPEPGFLVRLPDTGEAYYSIRMAQDELVYGVYVNAPGSMSELTTTAAAAARPAELDGSLMEDNRDGAKGWIAKLDFRYLPRSERVRARPRSLLPQ